MKHFDECSFVDVARPCNLCVSPDGKHLLYTLIKPDLANDLITSNLFIIDLETGYERQLTNNGMIGNAIWEDNEHIIFPTPPEKQEISQNFSEEKVSEFCRMNIYQDSFIKYFSIPLLVNQIWRLSNNTFLVWGGVDINPGSQKTPDNWLIIDKVPFRSNGRGYIDQRRGALFIYQPEIGNVEQISSNDLDVTFVFAGKSLSELGSNTVYFLSAEYKKQKRQFRQSLFKMDLSNFDIQLIYKDNKHDIAGLTYWNGRLRAALITNAPGIQLSCTDMASMLPNGKDLNVDDTIEWVFGGMGSDMQDLYIIQGWQAQMSLFKMNSVNSESVKITDDEINVQELCCENGKVIFTANSGDGLVEIYIYQNGDIQRLTNRSKKFEKKYLLSSPRLFKAIDNDGFIIPFWVMMPVNFQPKKKYPAILSIHGGPDGMYDRFLNFEHQMFTGAGYFVIFCNPRGSISYGRKYMEIPGGLGGVDYENLILCLEAAVHSTPQIDADRLYVTGCSYGGYMTNWIIGQTDRFKGAAPRVSVSNWLSLHGTTDYLELTDWMHQATPWKNMEKLWNSSPLKYANKVKTPTLFITHSEDFRCPMEQTEQMFTALIEHGIEARMLVNKNASHFDMSPLQQENTLKEIISWFDCHR